jgi:WD40 repeat protein
MLQKRNRECICESCTNRMLVAGLASGVVVVLEPDTLQKRRTFNRIQRDIGSESTPFIDRSIVSQNGRILIRKNSHTSFGSWDLVTGFFIQNFNSYDFKLGEIGPISLSADGTQAATAHRSRYRGGDGHIAIWDIETGSLLHVVENYRQPPMDILFSPDGLFLICSDEGGECTELCLNGLKFSTRHIHTGQYDASPMSTITWDPGSFFFCVDTIMGRFLRYNLLGMIVNSHLKQPVLKHRNVTLPFHTLVTWWTQFPCPQTV